MKKLISSLWDIVRGSGSSHIRPRSPMWDALERRQMLDGTALIIDGTGNDDVIDLSIQGTDLVVVINGVAQNHALSSFTSLTVNGLAGNDLITLNPGVPSARLNGGAGNDTLVTGTGNDTLDGGAGDDTYKFRNGWGSALLIEAEGAGNDTIDFSAVTTDISYYLGGALTITDGQSIVNHGLNQIENFIGGAGKDTFLFQTHGSVAGSIDGGPGTNALVYSDYTTAVSVNLATGVATGVGGGVANINVLVGSAGNDTLIGSAAAERINGGLGNDYIDGGGGADEIVFSPNSGVKILGPSFGGTLDLSAFTQPLLSIITPTGVSVFLNGQMVLSGPATASRLIGGQANDRFLFQNGASFAGVIDGGGGVNTLDYRQYTTGIVVRLNWGIGTGTGGIANVDNVLGGSGNDILVGNANTNRLYGYGGNDKIYGLAGNDFLRGGAGNDFIKGGAGNDTIYGDAGHDKIYGEAGNDRLYGGAGNDTIDGGAGIDLLDGGAGNDVLLSRDRTRDVLRGGPGTDKARIDPIDRHSGIEILLK